MTLKSFNIKAYRLLKQEVNNYSEMLKNTNANLLPEPDSMFKLALHFKKGVAKHN